MISDLYKLLDEKDEEIHIVTRLNEQLKGECHLIIMLFLLNIVQLLDSESLVSTMGGDRDKQSGEFQSLHNALQGETIIYYTD